MSRCARSIEIRNPELRPLEDFLNERFPGRPREKAATQIALRKFLTVHGKLRLIETRQRKL
jgi:hypothetical protein